MFRSATICAALVVTAFSASAWAGELTSLSISELAARDRLEVRTAKYVLRLVIIDPAAGEAMASLSNDGVHFGQQDRVFVLGATNGRHEGMMFVRMGRLELGKGIELAVHTMDAKNRRVTPPVDAFRVERDRKKVGSSRRSKNSEDGRFSARSVTIESVGQRLLNGGGARAACFCRQRAWASWYSSPGCSSRCSAWAAALDKNLCGSATILVVDGAPCRPSFELALSLLHAVFLPSVSAPCSALQIRLV